MQVQIFYTHPETDNTYTVTATFLKAVKSPQDSFDRFMEPEDEDEIQITSIVDQYGRETPESEFDGWMIQAMIDECFMEACEL